MARKTKDEAEKTRNAILDAAEGVFYERGVSRTSIAQIAKAAGVTRGAVYWHFRDKLELCTAMADRVFLPHEDMLNKLVAKSSDTPLSDLKDALIHALILMATDKRKQNIVTILTLRCEYVEEMIGIIDRRNVCKERMLVASEKLLSRARKLKMLSPHWTPHKCALMLQALMTGLISSGLERRTTFDFATVGVMCVETFFKSLRAD
jgi:AcrR family transcriptional regulator